VTSWTLEILIESMDKNVNEDELRAVSSDESGSRSLTLRDGEIDVD
jgi:hypothetical protein